jgi:hypothetical protein
MKGRKKDPLFPSLNRHFLLFAQGREKDFIILSCVRSNVQHQDRGAKGGDGGQALGAGGRGRELRCFHLVELTLVPHLGQCQSPCRKGQGQGSAFVSPGRILIPHTGAKEGSKVVLLTWSNTR